MERIAVLTMLTPTTRVVDVLCSPRTSPSPTNRWEEECAKNADYGCYYVYALSRGLFANKMPAKRLQPRAAEPTVRECGGA